MTSFLFPDKYTFSLDRLKTLLNILGNDKNKLVIDLSCRRQDERWFVATDKWQKTTRMELNQG